MKYFFGIDGGGTKARIRITDENQQILYEGAGECTNIYGGNRDLALHNMKLLIEDALNQAGLTKQDITAGCVSSAGLDRHMEKTLFSAYMQNEVGLCAPVHYCNDGESLLVGGLGAMQGICLISGTGALAVGRLEDGTLVRSGGLGYMIGDEGSAYWIMHQAICRSMRSIEHRDLETAMMSSLVQYFRLSAPEEFIPLLHSRFQKADIAGGASLVTDFALNQDPLAVDILNSAVEELIGLIRSVIIQLPLLSEGSIVLSGGVLERDQYIKPRFIDVLTRQYPTLRIADKQGDAVLGACLLAEEHMKVHQAPSDQKNVR